MSDSFLGDDFLELFLFETKQNIEQLESLLILAEEEGYYSEDSVNEIFRIMHTLKGSATLMGYESISKLAHKAEDFFYYIREGNSVDAIFSELSDVLLECLDFMKLEVVKVSEGDSPDGDNTSLIDRLQKLFDNQKGCNKIESVNNGVSKVEEKVIKEEIKIMETVKNDDSIVSGKKYKYQGFLRFEEDTLMANLRAFTIINAFDDDEDILTYYPPDILDNHETANYILDNGFKVDIETDKEYADVLEIISDCIELSDISLKELKIEDVVNKKEIVSNTTKNKVLDSNGIKKNNPQNEKNKKHKDNNSVITVNINKLDKLMDLIGELVMSEEMVTQNPDLLGLEIENFRKAARQLRKVTHELQDSVMSIRMVPLGPTFMKMHRITRDMSKKLNKDIELIIKGEDTEIDKSVIEQISDPLMHLIRNSIDHGIEDAEERIRKGKSEKGKVILEGVNSSSEVLIIIKDDGKGLDRDKIIQKAMENGILNKNPEEMTDKEVYSLILEPGFSTKEEVTEFSGRGVGMDVVAQNIASIGGSIDIDSVKDEGLTITLKIPLTLAIIAGMNIRIGKSRYTIPTISIKESFVADPNSIVSDVNGVETIMVRGQCYPIVRMHKIFNIATDIQQITDGVIVMIENESNSVCLLVDELLGGQQVVVKSLPKYMNRIKGISGCTILGDGNVSLILDVATLTKEFN